MPSPTENKLVEALQRALEHNRKLLGANSNQGKNIVRLEENNVGLVAEIERLNAEKAEQLSEAERNQAENIRLKAEIAEQLSEVERLRNAVKSLVNAQSASSRQTKATRSHSTSSAAGEEVQSILRLHDATPLVMGPAQRTGSVISRPLTEPKSSPASTLPNDGGERSTSRMSRWSDIIDDLEDDSNGDNHSTPSLLSLTFGQNNTNEAESDVKSHGLKVEVYSDDEPASEEAAEGAGADDHHKIIPPMLTRGNSFEPLKQAPNDGD